MTARKPLVLNGAQLQQIQPGDTVLTQPCATANASLNAPHGTAPTSPVDGDIWTTSAGLYVRVNGATVGPLAIAYTDEQAQDAVAAALVAGSGVTITYSDPANTITIASTGGGGTGGGKIAWGAPPIAYQSVQTFTAGFAVGFAVMIPAGATIERIGFVASGASPTTTYRVAVYSDSGFTINAKQQESNLQTGVLNSMNSAALTAPYVNSSGGDQIVWLVLCAGVANFSMGVMGITANTRFWNNSGTTLPTTAPTQTTSNIAWALWGFGSGGT